MTVSIVIADKFPAVRRGIRAWLAGHADLQVIGEAADGSQALRLVKRFQPDVLVIGVRLPGLNGPDVLGLVRKQSPRTRGVVYSGLPHEEQVVEALRNGALGYVLKRSPADVLVRAIRSAARGAYFLDAPFSEWPVETYLAKAKARPADPLDSLTPREKEVFHFVAQGHSSAEIARRLHLSPRTVEQHRAQLKRKLDLRNRTELIRFALRRGIIALEE
jgi:DNA-binding NarL/FixJ family response regulator